MEQKDQGLKSSLYASLALAFASFGDAFLYPFLPVNHSSVGVPIAWIGVLLSVNRFIRIISNSGVVHLFDRLGLRTVTIGAVLLAIISTAGYAFANSILLWLMLRIVWGLSFSALRIGAVSYAFQHTKQGLALGVGRSVQEAGPAVALLIAPLLLTTSEPKTIFLLLSLFSIPALYFAIRLPRQKQKPLSTTTFYPKFPSALNLITFMSAVVVDGILIVVLGVLFIQHNEKMSLLTATGIAAFYLGYRRVCLIAMSPFAGWLADKVGMNRVFDISMALVIVGLIVVFSGMIAPGIVIVFTFFGVNVAITPAAAAKDHARPLAAVAENATWRDIGAASGTLAGGLLMVSPYLAVALLCVIFSLTSLLLVRSGTARKLIYLWK